MTTHSGHRITAARKAIGLSTNRLAELADVDQSLLNKIERGQRQATAEVIAKLAPVLGVPVDEMQAWADADRLGEEGMRRLFKHAGGHLAREEAVSAELARLGAELQAIMAKPSTPKSSERGEAIVANIRALKAYSEEHAVELQRELGGE